MLVTWGKTPMDMGLPLDDVDPAYLEAMTILQAALDSERALHSER
jgi:hypothetical protein